MDAGSVLRARRSPVRRRRPALADRDPPRIRSRFPAEACAAPRGRPGGRTWRATGTRSRLSSAREERGRAFAWWRPSGLPIRVRAAGAALASCRVGEPHLRPFRLRQLPRPPCCRRRRRAVGARGGGAPARERRPPRAHRSRRHPELDSRSRGLRLRRGAALVAAAPHPAGPGLAPLELLEVHAHLPAAARPLPAATGPAHARPYRRVGCASACPGRSRSASRSRCSRRARPTQRSCGAWRRDARRGSSRSITSSRAPATGSTSAGSPYSRRAAERGGDVWRRAGALYALRVLRARVVLHRAGGGEHVRPRDALRLRHPLRPRAAPRTRGNASQALRCPSSSRSPTAGTSSAPWRC
jgi:hypothetical protein